jgi:arginine deiminase
VSYSVGTDSEVGCLRTVLVHRPGPELRRVTPRTRTRLRFDGQPWLARAQQEHDVLTDVLRDRGAEVLYLTELLQDVLEYQSARDESIASVLADAELGDVLGTSVRRHLDSLAPEDLAAVLVAGLTPAELRSGSGLVYDLLDPHDFVIDPLPNLVFTRDSSTWIGDQPVVASLPGPRHRENKLMAVIYGHHPRFGGVRSSYEVGREQLDGGDVLLLGPGVVAVGVGVRTTPASAERLARHLLDTGVVHTVLAVPMNQRGEGGHLDRICTVVDSGVVIMVPALAFTLTALSITQRRDETRVSRPRPFVEAAAEALSIGRLTVIDTGLDSQPGGCGQWDDGGNALAIGPGIAVCCERNVETNARLAAAGLEVVTVPASELGGIRGGPRGMCAPVLRDPAVVTALNAAGSETGRPASVHAGATPLDGAPVPVPARPADEAGRSGLADRADQPDDADQARRVGELTPLG